MKKVDYSSMMFSFDEPVPIGYGNSKRWRGLRENLNSLLANNKPQLSASVAVPEDATKEDITAMSNALRAAYYNWRDRLDEGKRALMNAYTTTVISNDGKLTMYIYHRERAVRA